MGIPGSCESGEYGLGGSNRDSKAANERTNRGRKQHMSVFRESPLEASAHAAAQPWTEGVVEARQFGSPLCTTIRHLARAEARWSRLQRPLSSRIGSHRSAAKLRIRLSNSVSKINKQLMCGRLTAFKSIHPRAFLRRPRNHRSPINLEMAFGLPTPLHSDRDGLSDREDLTDQITNAESTDFRILRVFRRKDTQSVRDQDRAKWGKGVQP